MFEETDDCTVIKKDHVVIGYVYAVDTETWAAVTANGIKQYSDSKRWAIKWLKEVHI